VNGSFEVLWTKHVVEVEQGARHGCDRDALVHGHVLGGQPPRAVDSQAPPTHASGARRDGHMNQGGRALTDVPVGRGIKVREHRPGTARQDGGHPVTFAPELPMTYGEDAAVEAKKAVGPHALPDSGLTNARSAQLPARDHAVLPPGNDGQLPIRRGWGAFWVHMNP